MHCVPAPLALRGFGPGFDSSRAQNPDPQRVRRRFFMPKARAQAITNVLSVTFPIQGLRARQKRSKVLFVACAMRRKHSWRIRLAAYGARLERVLG